MAFDLKKIVGLVIGVVAGFRGVELSAENWEVFALANAGTVAAVEAVLKPVLRLVGYDVGAMA